MANTNADVLSIIFSRYEDGETAREIADELHEKGYRTVFKKKWTAQRVNSFITYHRRKGTFKANTASRGTLPMQLGNGFPQSVVAILHDNEIDPTKRVNMLKAFLGMPVNAQ